MPGIAVVGTQWGDEGKGKVIDLLARSADVVARYQGGPNAGHTVQAEGRKFQLHHVPSGILHPRATCIIGNGVVILPDSLLDEMRVLREAGIPLEGRLLISNRAHVILPVHVERDGAAEDAGSGFGTTRRGVGPCYEAKAARRGVRTEDLLDADRLRRRVAAAVGDDPRAVEATVAGLEPFAREIRPFLADTVERLFTALESGQRVLFEGAQGTMLDLDHGSYPWVTSSNSSAGGICAGLGVGPTWVDGVVGVMKAYATRVGLGPMPTELPDATGDRLRERGREYGTTTGRPRRCGWFDGIVGRRAVVLNRLDSVALTLFDVLDEFDTVRLCTGYRYRGETLRGFPLQSWALEEVEPVYEDLPGWQSDTSNVRRFEDLPERARAYVRRIEEVIGCEVGLVSVGPDRECSILRDGSKIAGWAPDAVPGGRRRSAGPS